jgi:hypothetical protein
MRVEVRPAHPVFVEEKLRRMLGQDVPIIIDASRLLARGRDKPIKTVLKSVSWPGRA